ncbi:Phosphate transport (Pho88) [Fragilaria crotonensis]|nr:Phosphate transport (Pho88) [Fragilaria crotonensis]
MTHCSLLRLLLLHACILQASATFRPIRKWGSRRSSCTISITNQHGRGSTIDNRNVDIECAPSLNDILQSLRAGATVEDDGDNDVEDDDTKEDEEEEQEEEEEEEDDEQEEADADEQADDEDEESDEEETSAVASTDVAALSEYDEMLIPSPSMQMYSVIGVMLLSRKLDMFNPTVVRAGRFLYIAYVILLQLFLLYVRLQAKSINNRTPIQMTSPFSKILESTQNTQVKNLASSLLSSQSTVLEYDLAQIKSMNGGLLMNMAFLWFLHYKMGQTQPLYLQTVQGLMNLYYSPLFQVYVLGRNLERPFKNPTLSKLMDDKTTSGEDDTTATSSSVATDDEDDEEDDDDNDVEDDDNDDDNDDEGDDDADEGDDNAHEETKLADVPEEEEDAEVEKVVPSDEENAKPEEEVEIEGA